MIRVSTHPEDIKAELRKKHGSLGQFEKARDLPARSVTDVLRGKPSRPTAQAIADELGVSIHKLFPDRFAPANADCSNTHATGQSLRRGSEKTFTRAAVA